MPRTALEVRHEAALALLQRGEIDPYEALCLVCWPEGRLEDERVSARAFQYDAAVRAEALALYDSGVGAVEIARRLGVSYGTAKGLGAAR